MAMRHPIYGSAFSSYDLATFKGTQALVVRTAMDAAQALRERQGEFAGRPLDEVADELAREFWSQSQSIPREAFRDPEAAKRELRILYVQYRWHVGVQLAEAATNHFRRNPTMPPVSDESQILRQRREREGGTR